MIHEILQEIVIKLMGRRKLTEDEIVTLQKFLQDVLGVYNCDIEEAKYPGFKIVSTLLD